MNDRDLVRRLLDDEDDFEGDLNIDFKRTNTLRKMKDQKEKLGGGKPKREKPEWKQPEKEKDDE